MNINKKRIKALLKKLDDGKNVSKRDIENTLGKQALEEYESEWQLEQDTRLKIEDKPKEIKEYEDLLRQADFAENRADGIKVSKRDKRDHRNRNSQVRLRQTAETLYEDAITRCEEIVTANPSYRAWFDRDLDFTPNGDLYTSSCKAPRIVTSRSTNKINSIKARAKQDVKRDLLQRYLDNDYTKELSKVDKVKLKGLLQKLNQVKD